MATWRTWLKEDLLLFSLLFTSPERRLRALYDSFSHNYFTEKSHFLNLGYWKDSPDTLDAACEALTNLVGEAGEFKSSDVILDAGFGLGDQDLFWMERFSPQAIVGLNIAPAQVEFARKRAAERELEGRLKFQVGSATEVPFGPESFDKVVALESAFHFNTRELFFKEAFRVLRPGGRLVTADLVAMPPPEGVNRKGLKYRALWMVARVSQSLMPSPPANDYARDVYARKMGEAGFVNVRVETIREEVFAPFIRYLARRLQDPDIKRRINPGMWRLCQNAVNNPKRSIVNALVNNSDYVIATGDKPAPPSTDAP